MIQLIDTWYPGSATRIRERYYTLYIPVDIMLKVDKDPLHYSDHWSLIFFPQNFLAYYLRFTAGDFPNLMSLAAIAATNIEIEWSVHAVAGKKASPKVLFNLFLLGFSWNFLPEFCIWLTLNPILAKYVKAGPCRNFWKLEGMAK